MFKSIFALLLVSGSVFAVPSEPLSYIIQVDDAQLLERDLTLPLPEQELTALKGYFAREGRKPRLTSTRRDEIQMALGLLAIQEKQFDQAHRHFQNIPPASWLYEAALFHGGRAHRLEGSKWAEQKRWPKSFQACEKAKVSLSLLREGESTPYARDLPTEQRETQFCSLRAAIQLGKASNFTPQILEFLQEESSLSLEDLESMVMAMIHVLKKEKREYEAYLLAEDYGARYPQLEALQKERSRLAKDEKMAERRLSLPETQTRLPLKPRLPEEDAFSATQKAMKRKHWTEATRQLVSIFTHFPGSVIAQKAQGTLQTLLGQLLREGALSRAIINQLKDLPSSTLYEAAKTLWKAEKNDETSRLLLHLIKEDPTSAKASNAYYVLARIAEDRQEWGEAREYYAKLVAGYSASSFYLRSRFKLGWLPYMEGHYQEALKELEKELAWADGPRYEAQALYWMAKCYDALKKPEKAEKLRQRIAQNAPLTYYAVLLGKMPPLETLEAPPLDLPQDFWSYQALQKAISLLASGLPQEAGYALEEIKTQGNASLERRVSRLFQVASIHPVAITRAYQALLKKGSPPLPLHLMELFFPIDHQDIILKTAQAQGVDPLVLQSLIKQESAYRTHAVSRAGALGLMQLMPQTAKTVARTAQIHLQSDADILQVETNITLGTRYLANILEKFDGNLVYALASYNAGPTRVEKWVDTWKSLPTDVFVELMPLDETRNYVKSILRNRAFYTYLSTLNKNQLPPNDSTQVVP